MFQSLIKGTLRASRTQGVPMVARRSIMTTRIAMSKSDDGKNVDDKKSDYKSILDDDLLSKAGVDVDEPSIKKEGAETEGEGASSPASSELNEKLKKKFEAQRAQQKRKSHTTQTDIKRERYANLFYTAGFLSIAGSAVYMSRDWEKEGDGDLFNEEENGYTPDKMFNRFKKRFNSVFNLFTEPAFNDLLPPPPPEPYKRPLTLVLSLEDLLVHSEWSTKKGWKTAKRPGLDYFLGYLSQYYEVVIFSSNYMQFSEVIVQKLDPYHAFISYSLFKEASRYIEGKVVKDLSLMNRDLSKMIMIDTDPDAWSLQPDNAIPFDAWDGTPDDKLVKLIPFLEYLATQPIKDVRPILNSFKDKKKIPEEFLEREALLRKKFEEDYKLSHSGNNASNWAVSLLGLPSSVQSSPKMPLDVIREQGQKQYLQFQSYLKEHGAKMLEEEKQREKEFLAENKFTLEKILTEGMPTAEEVAKQQAAKASASSEK